MAHLADNSGDAYSNLVQGTGTNSATFTVPGNVAIDIRSVVATIDNAAGAATTAELTVRDQAGVVVATQRQGTVIPAAGSGTATWALRLGGDGSETGSGIPLIDLVDFNPAAGFVQITSVNSAAPTTVATSGTIIADGATSFQILFYAGAIDMDQRGFTGIGTVLLELYVNGTASGVVLDFNTDPGSYGVVNCNLIMFDTPAAGNTVYAIKGWREVSGGTGPGNSFVYGSNITTPHATRPGFLAVISA